MTNKEYIVKVLKNVKAMRDRATQESMIPIKRTDTILEQIGAEQEHFVSKARAAAFQEVYTMMRTILEENTRGEEDESKEQ